MRMPKRRQAIRPFFLTVASTLYLTTAVFSQQPAGKAGHNNATHPQNSAPQIAAAFAKTDLAAKSGTSAGGTAVFAKSNKGIEVTVTVHGMSAGNHGIHIHEKGDCSAADASSAGGHYNPTKGKHGAPHGAHSHAGDWGNINVTAAGTGTLKYVIPEAETKAWKDGADLLGRSIVVHAKADDMKTDPSGNSGDRIACGVIEKAP